VKVWIQDEFERITPQSPPQGRKRLVVRHARGEVISFQVGVRPDRTLWVWEVSLGGSLARRARVRLAELVPIKHHSLNTPPELTQGLAPGFTADPLVEPRCRPHGTALAAGESRCFWVTLRLPNAAPKDGGDVSVTVASEGKTLGRVVAKVEVLPFTLPKFDLPYTQWFYSDALADWYETEPFSRLYWTMVERYFRNMTDHGQTMIYTPLFTPPLDTKKRDLQLVDVTEAGRGRYRFGWGKLRRWLRLARDCGFRYFEMSHLFSQWGAKYAIRILVRKPDGRVRPLCRPHAAATCGTYRRFLEQFLPALLRVLRREGIYDRCMFHLADEPEANNDGSGQANYEKVRRLVRHIVPQVKVFEAIGSYDTYERGLVDNPVPVLPLVPEFLARGVRPYAYHACCEQGTLPNRYLDYPLYRLRVIGLMLFRFGIRGFLHWGLNYWYRSQTTELINPYLLTDSCAWPMWGQGEGFVVYPGADGPVDSIRWEAYRAAVDDYRFVAAAAKKAGNEKALALLGEIAAPGEFPQNADFLRKVRGRAIRMILGGRSGAGPG